MRRNFILIQALMLMGLFTLRTLPLTGEFSFSKSVAAGIVELLSAVFVIYGNVYLINTILNEKKRKWLYSLLLLLVLSFGVFIQIMGFYLISDHLFVKESKPFNPSFLFFLVTLLELSIYVILSTPIKFAFDYFKLRQHQQEIENERLQTELKYLKLQINPHFLFNTLNNLLALAKSQSNLTAKVIEKLAFLMRYLLEESNFDSVSLEKEIDFINAYLELEKIRVPQVDLVIDVEGEPKNKTLPPLLFLPLVENAIKHGLHISANKNYVYIEFDISEHSVSCRVLNSIQSAGGHKQGGTGLANLEKRLRLLYGEKASLKYGEKENGSYLAQLSIPL